MSITGRDGHEIILWDPQCAPLSVAGLTRGTQSVGRKALFCLTAQYGRVGPSIGTAARVVGGFSHRACTCVAARGEDIDGNLPGAKWRHSTQCFRGRASGRSLTTSPCVCDFGWLAMNDNTDPWDNEIKATSPDPEMTPLDQLKLYQKAIRTIVPFLDAFESAVLLQIIDRITGWKKHEARFSAAALYAGDRMYGGLSRTMDRSRMMKALRSLEDRQLIGRKADPAGSQAKIYWVNFDVENAELAHTARPISKSAQRSGRGQYMASIGGQPVQNMDGLGAVGGRLVSSRDTIEGYQEKGIGERNTDTSLNLALSAQVSGSSFFENEEGIVRPAQVQSARTANINPPSRKRT